MAQTPAQQEIFPGIAIRAVALMLDLGVLGVAAVGAGAYLPVPPYVFPLLVFLYFAIMPLSPWQGTAGKWLVGLKLCDRQGVRLGWRSSVVRAGATLCWFAPSLFFDQIASLSGLDRATLTGTWWLLFALPWLPVAFMPRRESLFDLLAGSLVVRSKSDPASIASAESAQKPRFFNVVGTGLLLLATGAVLSVVTPANVDMNRRARINYAIQQTVPLREKIEAFHDREKRWPTAGELGVPEWTPFRDGGGYRLQADGSIVITFSVLPELKGRSITSRPIRPGDGKKIQWQCSADTGFKRAHLPAACRDQR